MRQLFDSSLPLHRRRDIRYFRQSRTEEDPEEWGTCVRDDRVHRILHSDWRIPLVYIQSVSLDTIPFKE